MTEQTVRHEFVDGNGEKFWPGPTRLGVNHEIVATWVSVDFDGTIVFTHTLARQKIS